MPLSHIAVFTKNMDLLAEFTLCFGYLNMVDKEVAGHVETLLEQEQADGDLAGSC